MKVVIEETARGNNGFHAGIVKYANNIAQGLQQNGVDVQRNYVDVWEGHRFGAFVMPAARHILDRHSHKNGGYLIHAIEAKVGFRGTDVIGFHRNVDFKRDTVADVALDFYYQRAGANARLIIVNTTADIPIVRRVYGRRYSEKCRPLGVPTDENLYVPGPVNRVPIYDVAWIGKSSPNKNVHLMLRALEHHPEWKGFVLTTQHDAWPEYHSEAKRIAERCPNVKFVDSPISEEELVRTYQQSKVVALTSTVETFAAAPMEGLFCGARPVVPADHPFIDIYGQKHATYFRPESIEDLERAVSEAIAGPRHGPPSEITDRYSIAGLGRQLTSYYEELLRA